MRPLIIGALATAAMCAATSTSVSAAPYEPPATPPVETASTTLPKGLSAWLHRGNGHPDASFVAYRSGNRVTFAIDGGQPLCQAGTLNGHSLTGMSYIPFLYHGNGNTQPFANSVVLRGSTLVVGITSTPYSTSYRRTAVTAAARRYLASCVDPSVRWQAATGARFGATLVDGYYPQTYALFQSGSSVYLYMNGYRWPGPTCLSGTVAGTRAYLRGWTNRHTWIESPKTQSMRAVGGFVAMDIGQVRPTPVANFVRFSSRYRFARPTTIAQWRNVCR